METIIDAGSTKTAFVLLSDKGRLIGDFKGEGINPNYSEQSDILQIFAAFVRQYPESAHTDLVRYYGSGCASEANKARMTALITPFFPLAEVRVESDLMAVCHALSGGEPCIAGILGTGAATCLYDGRTMVSRAPSLGYWLGDEGSGANLGKRLLTAYLDHTLPSDLVELLQQECSLTVEKVMARLYLEPSPNVFMASLAPFLRQHQDHPFVSDMLLQTFSDFFAIQKRHYADCEPLPWHFAGSIAFHFKKYVRKAALRQGCRIGKMVAAPMPMLIRGR